MHEEHGCVTAPGVVSAHCCAHCGQFGSHAFGRGRASPVFHEGLGHPFDQWLGLPIATAGKPLAAALCALGESHATLGRHTVCMYACWPTQQPCGNLDGVLGTWMASIASTLCPSHSIVCSACANQVCGCRCSCPPPPRLL